jgi:hypothetical protein
MPPLTRGPGIAVVRRCGRTRPSATAARRRLGGVGFDVDAARPLSNAWAMLQLGDSALPTGAFAHSAGLEAAWQQGFVQNEGEFERFIHTATWQARHICNT